MLFKVFMKRNFRLWFFLRFSWFLRPWIRWAYLFLVTTTSSALYFLWKTVILGKKVSGPRVAKTACVASLVRVSHSKDGILKQWESELDSSSDILQCLNAVSSYKDYWILCICLHIKKTILTNDVTFGPRLRMPFYFKCSLSEWKKDLSSDLR